MAKQAVIGTPIDLRRPARVLAVTLCLWVAACGTGGPGDAPSTRSFASENFYCEVPDRIDLFETLSILHEEAEARGGDPAFAIVFNRFWMPGFLGGEGFRLTSYMPGAPAEEAALWITDLYRPLFTSDPADGFVVDRVHVIPDRSEHVVVALVQHHEGLPVAGGRVLLLLDENNDVLSLKSTTIPEIGLFAPPPTGAPDEVYYPAEDACDRAILATRTVQPLEGRDRVVHTAGGVVLSEYMITHDEIPPEERGVSPLISMNASERVYNLKQLDPDHFAKQVAVPLTEDDWTGQPCNNKSGKDIRFVYNSDYAAQWGMWLREDIVFGACFTSQPTIVSVLGSPPATSASNPTESKYAVVELVIGSFDPLRPPTIKIWDESSNPPTVLETITWSGYQHKWLPIKPQVTVPIFLAADPNPWANTPAGEPNERVTRIELLHCDQVVTTAYVKLVKSTRWQTTTKTWTSYCATKPDEADESVLPGGVYLAPVYWHDIREVCDLDYILNKHAQKMQAIYDAFFAPPDQTSDVGTGGTFPINKLIGQARVQLKLTGAKTHYVGAGNSYQCCYLSCLFGWTGTVSTGEGKPNAIDVYDTKFLHERPALCDFSTKNAGWGKATSVGVVAYGRTTNTGGTDTEVLTSAIDANVVTHEFGHFLGDLGHSNLKGWESSCTTTYQKDTNFLMQADAAGSMLYGWEVNDMRGEIALRATDKYYEAPVQ